MNTSVVFIVGVLQVEYLGGGEDEQGFCISYEEEVWGRIFYHRVCSEVQMKLWHGRRWHFTGRCSLLLVLLLSGVGICSKDTVSYKVYENEKACLSHVLCMNKVCMSWIECILCFHVLKNVPYLKIIYWIPCQDSSTEPACLKRNRDQATAIPLHQAIHPSTKTTTMASPTTVCQIVAYRPRTLT